MLPSQLVYPFTFLLLQAFFTTSSALPSAHVVRDDDAASNGLNHHKVVILGGGVSGVIAARTLHKRGITDFLIIEARTEIGGRMMSKTFGSKSRGNGTQYVIEQGANWVQGTQEGDGPINPVWELALKHGVKTQTNDWDEGISTYDATGQVDFQDKFKRAEDQYAELTVLGGTRVDKGLVDVSGRTGYSLIGAKAADPQSAAAEYFAFDFEYAQTPAQSSLIATSWGNNYTYDVASGGFSDENQMAIDQRGFKTLIQQEAAEFLQPSQIVYNSTVKSIKYSDSGVTVTLVNNQTYTADYAICTFSVGVLQNDDVEFEPSLPDYKQEAIQSMTMATYIKIFLQFPEKFWWDNEIALYADSERGRYPIWQSLDHPNFFPGSGIMFVTVTGDFAKRVEALPEAQVKAELLSVLRTMLPNATVPEPVDFFIPRWTANPLFRGSYSNWPPSFSSDHLSNLRANVGKLYFAGEANSRKFFGFLHGAYYEGSRIGDRIADCVQKNSCPDLPRFPHITNPNPYDLVARSVEDRDEL